MADDTARLEQALRKAAAGGDTAAAQRFAQAIRQRRAAGSQAAAPVQVAPTQASDPDDPLVGVPTEIGGRVLSDDIREAIRFGRQIEDPKEKRILQARIAGRLVAEDPQGDLAASLSGSQFGAGLRGFGAGIFGLGDLAAAGGTALRGAFQDDAMSFGEALEAQREFRRALEEEFPLTSGLAEVGGAVIGGGGVTLGAKAAFKAGTTGARAVSAATQFKSGQTGRNILRAAGLGATAGAVTEGITEGEAGRGALIGAAGGPLGLALIKSVNVSKIAVQRLLEDPAAKGLRALAKKLGETPGEMARRFLEFQGATGAKPSIADIANPQAVAELRDLIAERASAVAVAREGAEAVTRRRAGEVTEQITGGRVTTTKAAQQAARGRVAESQFAAIENQPFVFSGKQVDELLSDPDLRRALPATLRRRIDDVLKDVDEGAPATLSGLDVNDIRLALRDRARGATGADRVFSELANDIEDVARSQSDEFGRAIDEFALRSRRGEAVAAGRKVVTQPTEEFEAVARQVGDAPEQAALRVGARAGLADVAREGASQASRLTRALAEDSGLVRRLKSVLPADEVARLQTVGRVQARATQNIETLAPGVRAESDNTIRRAVDSAISAVVVAHGGTGGAFRASFGKQLLDLVRPKRISKRVAESLARDAFDPEKTGQVLTALRRAQVSEEDILALFASVVGGQQAAAATGE